MIQPLTITALNSSTFTAITLGSNQNCGAIGFWVEDGSAFYIATDSSGTDAGLTMEGQGLALSTRAGKGDILFYAKASSGTPNLVLMVTK